MTPIVKRFIWILFGLIILPINARGQNQITPGEIDAYATFRSVGLVVSYAGDDNENASAAVEYRKVGASVWEEGHFLARILNKRFACSLVLLDPGFSYQVEVTFEDPDGVTSQPSSVIVSMREEIFPQGSGSHYYVSPDGDDQGSGTINDPFETIQHAHDVSMSGDVIHVLSGVYRQEVHITRSGMKDAYITYIAEDNVVLDGSDESLATPGGNEWEIYSGDVYRTPLTSTTWYVAADGERLWHYDNLTDLIAGTAGVPGGWCLEGGYLYVKLPEPGNPDTLQMQVGILDCPFYLDDASFIIIDGFHLRFYGSGPYSKGVYLRGADHCVVRNNYINNINVGVWVKLESAEGNLIYNNHLYDTSIYSWPWDLVKGSDAENSGISVEGGYGNVIRNNEVWGYFNAIAASTWGNLWDETLNHDVDIYENELYLIGDDGLEPEGACINLRMWGNNIHQMLVGISLAPITVGPCWVWRNVMYDFTRTTYKFSSSTGGPCFVYHNTGYTDIAETEGMLSSGSWENMTFRNNILRGTRYAIEDYHLSGYADFDYDNLYTTDPNRFVKWIGIRYYTLQEFQDSTGQEIHGISGANYFMNPSGGDFHLSEESPNIDAGVVIQNFNDGYVGSAPDIGAYEYQVGGTGEDEPAQVYPNPCRVYLGENTVIFDNLNSVEIIKIYDVTGRLTHNSGNLSGTVYQWGVSSVSSGVYFYVIEFGGRVEKKSGKVVIIK